MAVFYLVRWSCLVLACLLAVAESEIFSDATHDWIECYSGKDPFSCLQQRTRREMQDLTNEMKKEMSQVFVASKRMSKSLKDESNPEESEELSKLEKENEDILESIRAKENPDKGFLDEISDFLTFGAAKILGYFSPGDISDTNVSHDEDADQGRGHKKKYLKKQNKHLKIILLIMLLKNKVKMFMQKLQMLIQFKLLGIAVVNLLINIVRLWIDLKKKKPHKVVYYENAHHQHHYDHEHIHDDHHHPSHSHYSHHEEEYGGGPWPWSRSYIEKQSEEAFQVLNTHNKPNLAAHNVVYLKQKPVR